MTTSDALLHTLVIWMASKYACSQHVVVKGMPLCFNDLGKMRVVCLQPITIVVCVGMCVFVCLYVRACGEARCGNSTNVLDMLHFYFFLFHPLTFFFFFLTFLFCLGLHVLIGCAFCIVPLSVVQWHK